MPNSPRPPAQKPNVGSGKRYGGISRTWWIVGGVATVGIVYYSVHKRRQAAAVDPNTVDPSLAFDGGSSGIPSGAGGAVGVTPMAPSDPFANVPPGSTVTYTSPDGSTYQVQQPAVPTGSTTAGGTSGGVDSSGGTTAVNTDTTTPAVVPAPVIAPPKQTVPINPALAWENTARAWFHAHHYNDKTVQQALTKYQLGEGLDHTHLGIVETAIRHFGALVGTPAVKILPVKSAHPKPKPKVTGRQKAHH
jgi:hypothetical protein